MLAETRSINKCKQG